MTYTIIADVSSAIVNLLRDHMVPDLILNADSIGLCSPDEKSDFVVGINLYDIQESEEVMPVGMKNNGIASQNYPSMFLNLYYIITVYSISDIKFKLAEEQKIMGRIMQIIHDTPIITEGMLGDGATGNIYKIKMDLQKIDRYEKVRLWNYPNVPYKLSLFYKVYPIEIPSVKTKEVRRVMDVDFTVEERGRSDFPTQVTGHSFSSALEIKEGRDEYRRGQRQNT